MSSGSDDLFQSLAEAVTMETEPVEQPRPLTADSTDMANQGVQLQEKNLTDECYLFQDESLAPIFCKSKLIPLKTITTQKLEKMQKEAMEKVQQAAQSSSAKTVEEEPETEEEEKKDVAGPSKSADVWTADD